MSRETILNLDKRVTGSQPFITLAGCPEDGVKRGTFRTATARITGGKKDLPDVQALILYPDPLIALESSDFSNKQFSKYSKEGCGPSPIVPKADRR